MVIVRVWFGLFHRYHHFHCHFHFVLCDRHFSFSFFSLLVFVSALLNIYA